MVHAHVPGLGLRGLLRGRMQPVCSFPIRKRGVRRRRPIMPLLVRVCPRVAIPRGDSRGVVALGASTGPHRRRSWTLDQASAPTTVGRNLRDVPRPGPGVREVLRRPRLRGDGLYALSTGARFVWRKGLRAAGRRVGGLDPALAPIPDAAALLSYAAASTTARPIRPADVLDSGSEHAECGGGAGFLVRIRAGLETS